MPQDGVFTSLIATGGALCVLLGGLPPWPLWRSARWGLASPGPGEYLSGEPGSAAAKASFNVKFVGGVGYQISNLTDTARIYFDELANQSATNTSGPLQVRLFVTTGPIYFGDTFTSWTVASWDAPQPLLPGYRYLNIDVNQALQSVPDGIYYVHLGAFESGSACTAQWCYDDFRTFATRVQVAGGYYSNYYPPPSIQPGGQVTAVEYFHPGFGHYFVTAQADEIAALDSGVFVGWSRTGTSFDVWTSGTGLADVCRFFTTHFAPKSSHFYTAIVSECALVKNNPIWQYEKLAFKVALPRTDGSCPVGMPLYRLYNDGTTGAPNHRYTTIPLVRDYMISQGFVPEDANTTCVPGGGSLPHLVNGAEGIWDGLTSGGSRLKGIVLSTGDYYLLYGDDAHSELDGGMVLGNGKSLSGLFTSTKGTDYSFRGTGLNPITLAANYVTRKSLNGNVTTLINSMTFDSTYNAHYEVPGNLAQLAGNYVGQLRKAGGGVQAIDLIIDASGKFVGAGGGCVMTGYLNVRSGVSIYTANIDFGGGGCPLGTADLYGIGFVDESTGKLYIPVDNSAQTNGALFVGTKQ